MKFLITIYQSDFNHCYRNRRFVHFVIIFTLPETAKGILPLYFLKQKATMEQNRTMRAFLLMDNNHRALAPFGFFILILQIC